MDFVNTMHENLTFTMESLDCNNELAFLDTKIRQIPDGSLELSWYRKQTDTGVLMNFHAPAPLIYKAGIVQGFIHRIFNATSNWQLFDKGLNEVFSILHKNQYPKSFIHQGFDRALTSILSKSSKCRTT